MRKREPDDVLDEIEDKMTRFGIRRFGFYEDNALALKWLNWMIGLSKVEIRSSSAAEIASVALIISNALNEPGVEHPSQRYGVEPAPALRKAAEIAAEFGELGSAVGFRQELRILAPDDEENSIELVRLLNAVGKTDDAVQELASIIADLLVTRSMRWQAVWLSPDVIGQNVEMWSKLRDRIRSLNSSDTEMDMAVESLALSSTGRVDEGIKRVATAQSSDPNPYLSFLAGNLEKRQGRSAEAISSFSVATSGSKEATAWRSFTFRDDSPLEQIVRIYLEQNQSRAALKMAERISVWVPPGAGGRVNEAESVDAKLPSRTNGMLPLGVIAVTRQRVANAALLEQLSVAAEKLNELTRASEFEKLRRTLLTVAADINSSDARLEMLRQTQAKLDREKPQPLSVDRELVSQTMLN